MIKDLSELVQKVNIDYSIELEQHQGFFNPNQVKFLVYGESGVGKTVFASTWQNPVYLDIDKGMSSVTKQVYRLPIETWTDAQNAYMFLASEPHPFKTVVIDSLNELQFIAMRNVISSFSQIHRPYNDLASQSDYGKMLDDFDKFVRALRGLPLNIVFTCNVAPREFETDAVQPQLIGKHSARNVARMMDVIGYLYKGEVEGNAQARMMVFDAPDHVTKDRSAKLPPVVPNPTYDTLLRYWTPVKK